jgi:glycosyltransferase involved in cell wall biosynthesis
MSGPPRVPRAYRVVGFLTGEFGLGVAARNTLRALEASGRRVERVTLQNRWKSGRDATPPKRTFDPGEITLFHMNPSDVAYYRTSWRPFVSPHAPSVCVPFWELPVPPAEWSPVLRAMDAVLAPTRFIADACASVMPPGRVIHYPQAAFAPPAAPTRDAWGFPPGVTVFLVSFDIGSDIDRKNPWAAIEAFRRAFPSEPGVRLVLKTKPWNDVPVFRAQAAELRERIALDPRIQVLDRSLAYSELMSLYASCDVMVALHRSEGLGLHLMEAMSLGKAVAATGWSGNTDFMSAGDSVPIRYTLVPVRSRHEAYAREASRPGQVWAEPDLAHAAQELRALHSSPERRRELGAAAAAAMEARRHALLAGGTYDLLEAMLPEDAERPGAFDRAVLTTRGLLYWKAIRGLPRALARRAGLSAK